MEFSAIVRRGADVRAVRGGAAPSGTAIFRDTPRNFSTAPHERRRRAICRRRKGRFLSQLIAVAARWVTMICVLPFSRSDSRARRRDSVMKSSAESCRRICIRRPGFASARAIAQALFLSARKVSATLGNRITEPLRLRRDKIDELRVRQRRNHLVVAYLPAAATFSRTVPEKTVSRCKTQLTLSRDALPRSFPSRPFRPGAKPLPSARKVR